jgi:hypothetical protein
VFEKNSFFFKSFLVNKKDKRLPYFLLAVVLEGEALMLLVVAFRTLRMVLVLVGFWLVCVVNMRFPLPGLF